MPALVMAALLGGVVVVVITGVILYKKSYNVNLTPLIRERIAKAVIEARGKGPYGKVVTATPYRRSLEFRHCGTGRVVVEVWAKEEESLPIGNHNRCKQVDHFVCPICGDEFSPCYSDY